MSRVHTSAALAEAMEQALEAWPARAGVLVAMVGSPPGATVTVDGQPFGTLPAQGRLPTGEHSLTASAPGFAQLRQRFSVPATGEQLSLRLELEPLGAERPGSRRGRGWIAGPVLLGLGAGALAAPVLVAMARRGCASEREGVCAIEDRTNDTQLIAIGATSGALALGTIVWSVAGARRGRARDVTVEVGVGRLRVAF